jgi:hypothetical protein
MAKLTAYGNKVVAEWDTEEFRAYFVAKPGKKLGNLLIKRRYAGHLETNAHIHLKQITETEAEDQVTKLDNMYASKPAHICKQVDEIADYAMPNTAYQPMAHKVNAVAPLQTSINGTIESLAAIAAKPEVADTVRSIMDYFDDKYGGLDTTADYHAILAIVESSQLAPTS